MDNLSRLLPKMLFGEDLKKKLACMPEYCDDYRKLSPGQRLLKLTEIYKVFVPQSMAMEIYQKLYTMTVLSLNQKGTKESIMQANANYRWINGGEYRGVITGASSSSIIGDSGIGKTSCVQRAIQLMGDDIRNEKPFRKIIPAMIVTTPYDCSSKGLLEQILLCIDQAMGTDYFSQSQKERYNAQGLMSLVCELCLLHIGTIILDEIQFLTQHKAGTMLYRMILQLINASGISIMLVGTNECINYFQQAPQIARRTAGLRYGNHEYGQEFRELTETLFRYQYIQNKGELTEGLVAWLFEHSGGNAGNLMAILHDAQEIAIMKGTERLDIAVLTSAYTKRMQMLHPYIDNGKTKLPATGRRKNSRQEYYEQETVCPAQGPSITDIAKTVKEQGADSVSTFREHIIVEEVVV